MKRGYVLVHSAEEWEETGPQCKAICHNSAKDIKPPPGLACKRIPPEILQLVNNITSIDGTNKFLFFLGVQGKEYMNDIEERFADSGWSIPLFISANIDFAKRHHSGDFYSTNEQCRALGSYFGIMDPVGGGLYPLHFFMVIDRFDRLRCKIPIQVNRWVSPQERFGVNMRDLNALVEAYVMYLDQR